MRFGIITHYDVHNHGAILQLTALIRVLSQRGITAKALQFDKNYDFLGVELKSKYNVSIKSIGFYLKYLLQYGLKKTLFNVRKQRLLNGFKKQNELIGDYYSKTQSLNAVIVGSDEVFALHTGPTPVFFGHALPTNHVFSYAGSFGPTTIEDVRSYHCEAFISSGLKAMKMISVRDQNSQFVVESLTGIKPVLVCDPVILYGYQNEISNLNKPDKPPYLLVYAYDNRMNDPEEIAIIKEYAHQKGLKVLSPGFYHAWCDYNVNVDPIELLSYFRYAEAIVTDTFHGSVMSIITNSPFLVRMRANNYNKLYNLLEEYGLSDRILLEPRVETIDSIFNQEINWNEVNREVEKRREDSLAFLEGILNCCHE